MLVKVKAKGIRLAIPIPYFIIDIAITILTSKFFQKCLNKWTKKHFERKSLDFTFPLIDKRNLKLVIEELKNYKGLMLVDVQAKDGTVVKIRL